MQKVIRRTQFAIAQAERRRLRRKAINLRDKWNTKRQNDDVMNQDHANALKRARLQRKEDWELGPLAPRRDVGNFKDTWGTVPSHAIDAPISTEQRRKGLELFGGKFCSIKEGDRVVILAGREKGRMGRVSKVDQQHAGVKVKGLNLVEVAVPDWLQKTVPEEQRRATDTAERLIPFADVRLVTSVYDPEKGRKRNVVVKEIVTSNFKRDVLTGQRTWDRKIAGTDIIIPWPKVDEAEKVDHPDDTLRITVEEKTFIPTLFRPPMPMTLIDELRNKYSKFRTRHTEEYIAAKEAEEAEKRARVASIKKMRTPLSEKNRKERKERKKRGKGVLTDAMLTALGQVMAKNKGLVVKETVEKTREKRVKRTAIAPPPSAEVEADTVLV